MDDYRGRQSNKSGQPSKGKRTNRTGDGVVMSTLEQQQETLKTLREAIQALKDLGFITEEEEE